MLRKTECPNGLCEWCWESGLEVEADGPAGDCLCAPCEAERAVAAAEALKDWAQDR